MSGKTVPIAMRERPIARLPQTLGGVLPSAARKFGARTALVCGVRSFSFVDLDQLSSRLANALRGLGCGPGDRISLYSQNCWEWIVSYYAIAKLGAIVNPLNVMLTPAEVLYAVRDCGARAILTPLEKSTALLDAKGSSPLQEVIVFGNTAPAGARSFEDLLKQGASLFEPSSIPADEISTIGYTSGTTGHPKGAMLTHENVLLNSALTANMHVRTSSDVVVTSLPTAHVYGNVVMNGAFLCGMKLVLLARFNEAEVLQAIQDHQATMFEGVPAMYMYLLAYSKLEQFHLESLTRCTTGGQTMAIAKMEEVEERFGCPLLELWGMTEIAGLGTTHPAYGPNRHGSIGVSLPYVQCRIADPLDAGKTLPEHEVGELMIRGPIVMRGYYGNDQATRETIEVDGWLHTGDLARMDERGYFYIVDRKKDMILTGGYNVYPAEVERVLVEHSAVAIAAVAPQPDEIKGEVPKAYVVVKPGEHVSELELINFCRERLAAYKVPRAVQFVDDLPKTSTGKILRRALRQFDAAACQFVRQTSMDVFDPGKSGLGLARGEHGGVRAEKWYFKSKDEGLARKLQDGITTHIFHGENIMISVAEIAPDVTSTIHSHPEEQWGYLLQGECVRVQGGEEVPMKAGDFWYTPGNTPHGVRTGDKGCVIMDIFSPVRAAYTAPGEGLAATEHVKGGIRMRHPEPDVMKKAG